MNVNIIFTAIDSMLSFIKKDPLFGFYGISTIVGYSMPNLIYTYILNILDLVGLGFMA